MKIETKKVDRLCVFCGQAPIDQNKEHIIPRWLIEFTGDLKRAVNFGINWNTGNEIKFAADQLVFPACSVCNTNFADLESKVKPLVISLTKYESLKAGEYKLILDWLDKIRIGLWLGFRYLNKDFSGITPSFHISKRIGKADRILLVYAFQDKKGLSYSGANIPLFSIMPSCLGIRINGIYLINASCDFMVSSRIGFPYPDKISDQKEGFKIESMRIRKTMSLPIFSFRFHKPCIFIAQMKVEKEFYLENEEIYQQSKFVNHLFINGSDVGSNIIDAAMPITRYREDNEDINFSIITEKDAVQFWKMTYQVLELQQLLFEKNFLRRISDPSFAQIIKVHKKLKNRFRHQMEGKLKD